MTTSVVGSSTGGYTYSGTSVTTGSNVPSVTSGQCRKLTINANDAAAPVSFTVPAAFGSPVLIQTGSLNRTLHYIDNANATRSAATVTVTASSATEYAIQVDCYDAPYRDHVDGGAEVWGVEPGANPIIGPSITVPANASLVSWDITAANFGRYHVPPGALTAHGMQAAHESFTSIASAWDQLDAGATGATASWTAELPSGTPNGAAYLAAAFVYGPAGSTITVTGGGEVDLSGTATPPTITTGATLPTGTVGAAYTQQLAGTGTGPFTWSIISGTLNTGLSMSSAGLISGTPTAAMTATINVKLVGAATPDATRLFTLTTVAGATAPNVPINPQAVALSASSIRVTYTDNSSDETGFEIRRKTSAGGAAAETVTKAANVTTHTFTGLTAGTTYYFDVRATGVSLNSAYTSEVSATTQSSTTMYAQILVEAVDRNGASINGSTGWKASVWTAPSGTDIVGMLLGQFTGQSFESGLVSGEARMRINLGSASGSVTNGQSLRVVLTDGTRTTGIISATAAT